MSTKLRCLLLDDELPALTYLRSLCNDLPMVEVLRVFNDPLKFLEEVKTLSFDLCVLDIEMQGMSGLEVARQIQPSPVIFTTAYKQYGAEAYELEALDYLGKPVQKERLRKAFEKAYRHIGLQDKSRTVQLNTSKGKTFIAVDEILHICNSHIDKRDKVLLQKNGTELLLKNISFDQLGALLPADRFCRISKKDLLALEAVKYYHQNQVVCSGPRGDLVLPLGDNYKKLFLEKKARTI